MIPILNGTLPIFLLILLGIALKRLPIVDRDVWHGLEDIGYYVLFPALLFLTLFRADFSGIEMGAASIGALSGVAVMTVFVLALWPLFRRGGTGAAQYTSVFQTATRWNGFVALAVADELFGDAGLAVVALVMALVILPINLVNVAVMIWFNDANRSFTVFLRRLATNTLVLAALAGIAARYFDLQIYPPFEKAIDMIASAALGMGMLMVGAGLRIRDTVRPKLVSIVPTVIKLALYPMVMLAACWLAGVRGDTLVLLTLCGSVPTAMNGYVLARQLGGDAPLYATTATLQTVACFFTIPVVILVASYVAG